jgi:multicomponent Na+:H+ antiporter subunit F
MTPDLFLSVSESIALGLLTLAVLLTLVRLLRGPSLADRIVALDLLTTLAVSLIGVIALRSNVSLQLDIALALCLVGFVSTIALTRYLLTRTEPNDTASPTPESDRGEAP